MPNGKPTVPEETRKTRRGNPEAKKEGKRDILFSSFSRISPGVIPAVPEGTHPKLPVHEGRKNDQNMSIIRKHRVPEEIRKEIKEIQKQKRKGN